MTAPATWATIAPVDSIARARTATESVEVEGCGTEKKGGGSVCSRPSAVEQLRRHGREEWRVLSSGQADGGDNGSALTRTMANVHKSAAACSCQS
eukprot:6195983-Pleurochrysis_carterae.AAC.1